jgi:hypothetical protein
MAWCTFLTTAVPTALGGSDPEPKDLPFALVELDHRNGPTAPPGGKRRYGCQSTSSSTGTRIDPPRRSQRPKDVGSRIRFP